MKKLFLSLGIIFLFIISAISPIVISNTIKTSSEIVSESTGDGGLMDSAWPMKCHDSRHTGRSPYNTVEVMDEIWQFRCGDDVKGGAVIDINGTIYFGSWDDYLYALNPNGSLKWKYNIGQRWVESSPAIDENGIIYIGTSFSPSGGDRLFAIYPDGKLKWKYNTGKILSSPVIGTDGTIYFGAGNYINALYSNGTLKWRFQTNLVVYSSPAIGEDSTIYCGSHDDYIYALNPNGSLKWKFKTGNWVHGSPTIADDGTVYCGSGDGFLYALYPNNGTLKWRCSVGWIWGSPSLDEIGTIYVGNWQMKFYAIYPNGTIKWTYNAPGRIWFDSSAAISADGTIYFGTTWMDGGTGAFIALNSDGTEKWKVKDGGLYEFSPAIGQDGTVYMGSTKSDKGYLYAFNRGELKADADGPHYGLIDKPVEFIGSATGGYPPYSYHWDFGDTHSSDEQSPQHTYTSPGNYTVTLTVTDDTGNTSDDSTWAWIQDGNSPPDTPEIDGPNKGTAGETYPYTFTTSDPEGLQVWYYIDWDDGSNTGWKGPYSSGLPKTFNHKWTNEGTYTIKCKAKDPYDDESAYGEFKITMPRDKAISSPLILRFLERYPLLQALLLRLRFQ